MISLAAHGMLDFEPETRNLNVDQILTDYIANIGNGCSVPVSEHTAATLSVIAACERIYSNTLAALPLCVRRRVDGVWVEDDSHYLTPILQGAVNRYTTSYRWKQSLGLGVTSNGNSYSQLIFSGRQQLVSVIPLDCHHMDARLVNGVPEYRYDGRLLAPDEVLHIRWRTDDGFTGRSPLDLARDAISVGLNTQRAAVQHFRHGIIPGALVETPATGGTSEQLKEYQKHWIESQQGAANAHKPFLTPPGSKVTFPSVNLEQLQFLELRKFTVAEISRFYGVPLTMLSQPDKANAASAEQQNLEFLNLGLRSLVENIEAELNMMILSPYERESVCIAFDLDDFLRADQKGRYAALTQAVGVPWMTVNEARRTEGLTPVDGGDVLYTIPGSKALADESNSEPEPEPVMEDNDETTN